MGGHFAYLTIALAAVSGVAGATTFFSDDFSSGTLDNWRTLGNVAIGSEGENFFAVLQPDTLSPTAAMYPVEALDPGSYVVQFDATFLSSMVIMGIEAWPSADPASFALTLDDLNHPHFLYLYHLTPTPHESYVGDAISNVTITPWEDPVVPPADVHVTLNLNLDDNIFFVLGIQGFPCAGANFDNVLVSPVSINPPIPEPSTIILLGCAVAGYATNRLRLRKT